MLAAIEPAELRLPDGAGMTNQMAYALADGLRQKVPIHWKGVLALEHCIEGIRERLGGEDPADEIVRSAVNKAKVLLEATAATLADHGITVELTDRDESDLAPIRDLLETSSRPKRAGEPCHYCLFSVGSPMRSSLRQAHCMDEACTIRLGPGAKQRGQRTGPVQRIPQSSVVLPHGKRADPIRKTKSRCHRPVRLGES